MNGSSYLGCTAKLTTQKVYTIPIHEKQKQNVSIKVVHKSRHSSLLVAENILSKEFCKDIINFCKNEHPLSLIDETIQPLLPRISYVFQTEDFAKNLFERLQFQLQDIITQSFHGVVLPLGFGVNKGKWKLHGIDSTLQVLKLQHLNEESMTIPKIKPQRINGFHCRSIFSVLILLNDDFGESNISVYFPKSVIDSTQPQTNKGKILSHGGIDNGYQCFSYHPVSGKGIIFTHDLLHSVTTSSSGNQWILKANIMVQRINFDFYHLAINDSEKVDYLKSLSLFEEAQCHEAKGELQEASDLYEKALSVVYSYPKHLELSDMKEIELSDSYNVLPDVVWFTIFYFLSGKEMENVMKAFPQLYLLQKSWHIHRYKMSFDFVSSHSFVPELMSRCGIISEMIFPDSFYFHENVEGCIRVAAFLSGYFNHNIKDNLVLYNPDTQQAVPISLYSCLQSVFTNQPLHGTIFSLSNSVKNADFTQQLSGSVDRAYMAMRHKSPYIGIPLCQKMKVDVCYKQVDDNTLAYLIKQKKEPNLDYEEFIQTCSEQSSSVAAPPLSPAELVDDKTGSDSNEFNSYEEEEEEEVSPEKLEEFETHIMNTISKNFRADYEINYDLVTTGYFGNVDSIASFPHALKDILRYLKWRQILQPYLYRNHLDSARWVLDNLIFHNQYLYYLTLAPLFQNVYGDGKFHEPASYTASQLYTKCLTDSCKEYAGMNVTVVSELKDSINVPGSSICVCQPPFESMGNFDNFLPFKMQKDLYYNNAVFDFNSHIFHVEKDCKVVQEADCLFYNSMLNSFREQNVGELENVFQYTVYLKPIVESNTPNRPTFPSCHIDQSFNPYECECVGPDFKIKSCFNVEEFLNVNHIHIVGGTNTVTHKVSVWTAFGGMHTA